MEHEPDHREKDEGASSAGEVLEVLGEAATASEPSESSLDDPSFGQDDEAPAGLLAGDDELPGTQSRELWRQFGAGIGTVGPDDAEGGEACLQLGQHRHGAVTVLHAGRLNSNAQREAECVDDEMTLLALDLLVRVEARRINLRPPFSAPRTLWLSMIAAVGSAA